MNGCMQPQVLLHIIISSPDLNMCIMAFPFVHYHVKLCPMFNVSFYSVLLIILQLSPCISISHFLSINCYHSALSHRSGCQGGLYTLTFRSSLFKDDTKMITLRPDFWSFFYIGGLSYLIYLDLFDSLQ